MIPKAECSKCYRLKRCIPFPPDRWYCKTCWEEDDHLRPRHIPWSRDAYARMVKLGEQKASWVSQEVVVLRPTSEARR